MMQSSSYHVYRLETMTEEHRFDDTSKMPGIAPAALQTLRKKWAPYCMQAAAWLILCFFPAFLFMNGLADGWRLFIGLLNINYLVPFMLLMGFSYVNHFYFIPQLYTRKAFLQYFFLVICCLSATIFCTWLAGNEVAAWPLLNYIITLFVLGITGSIYLHCRVYVQKRKMKQLEIALLNSRINPHFLFNSLNWIYSLAIDSAEETPRAIIHLSGMMRYLTKDVNADFVDLKKELNYIKNYVFLQKGKLDHSMSVTSSIPAYTGALLIAPLLMMSFIENAFKYGVNPQEDSAINIDISLAGNKLYLQIINNKVSSMYNAEQSGVGIENARQRLELLYPGLYQLDILDDFKIYSVKLSIMLQ